MKLGRFLARKCDDAVFAANTEWNKEWIKTFMIRTIVIEIFKKGVLAERERVKTTRR